MLPSFLPAEQHGGGSNGSSDAAIMDPAVAEQLATAAADAAFGLATVLATAASVSGSDAQDVATSLSLIMDAKVASEGQASATSAASAAEGISAVVDQLARAAAAGAEAGFLLAGTDGGGGGGAGGGEAATAAPVVVTSKNFNMSIAVRSSPTELAAAPFECDAAGGEPATVSLPAAAVEGAVGFDPSLPVAAILFTTPVSLHPAPQARARRRTRRHLAAPSSGISSGSTQGAASVEAAAAAATTTTVSPTVSFSLSQQDRVLEVKNASAAINVSIPFVPSPSACLLGAAARLGDRLAGTDEAERASVSVSSLPPSCATTVECRWWDERGRSWSTEGCVTVYRGASGGGDATVSCACDHLTEFLAFEFPTSVEELIATLLDAISMQTLSERALLCVLDSRHTWRTLPVLYGCVLSLLLLFALLISNAVFRDRAEVRLAVALLAGKRRSEQKPRALRKTASSSRRALLSKATSAGSTRRIGLGSGQAAAAASPPPSPPSPPVAPAPPPDAAVLCGTGCLTSSTGEQPLVRADEEGPHLAVTHDVVEPFADEAQPVLAVQDHMHMLGHMHVQHLDISRAVEAAAAAEPPAGEPLLSPLVVEGRLTPHGEQAKPGPSSSGEARAAAGRLAQVRWQKGLHGAQAQLVATRWNKDVDRVWKRVCLACMSSHSLSSGICYRGTGNFTRAQTVMVLLNSFAFELVVLCIFYEEDEPREEGEALMTINIVGIVVGATYCAAIVIPVMLIFVWLFEPIIFVRLGRWVLRALFCWPCAFQRCLSSQHGPCRRWRLRTSIVSPSHSAVEAKSTTEGAEPSACAAGGADKLSARAAGGDDKLSASVCAVNDDGGAPAQQFAYTSLNDVMLKASLTHSWKVRDWASLGKILFGWTGNLLCFGMMMFLFSLYMCELFEPQPAEDHAALSSSNSSNLTATNATSAASEQDEEGAGNTDELLIAWALSCFQRFVRARHSMHAHMHTANALHLPIVACSPRAVAHIARSARHCWRTLHPAPRTPLPVPAPLTLPPASTIGSIWRPLAPHAPTVL